MKFEFNQKVEDLFDLSKNSIRSNKMIKYIGILFLVLLLMNILPSLLKGGIDLNAIISWILPIIVIFLIWFGILKFAMNSQLKNPENRKVMLGKRVIELLDEEILVKTPISDTRYKWPAITKLRQSKNSYFLYIGKSQALIIPKRILESEEAKTELENFVNERIGHT